MNVDVRFDQYERINNSFASGDVEYLADVESALADVTFIWSALIPELERTQRFGVVEYVLATQYSLCETVFTQDDMQLQLYARVPQTERVSTFGEDVVGLYDMQRGQVTDNRVNVVLGWWSETAPSDTYSVGVHLFDAEKNLVRQQDFGLPNQRPFTCTSTSLDLNGLPAGDYTLRTTVYEWQTGSRLLTSDNVDYADLQVITIGE